MSGARAVSLLYRYLTYDEDSIATNNDGVLTFMVPDDSQRLNIVAAEIAALEEGHHGRQGRLTMVLRSGREIAVEIAADNDDIASGALSNTGTAIYRAMRGDES